MAKPLVSVVMPVFNAARFLETALKSILGQTFTDFELIVIDDGSTDISSEILANYQKMDARIHLYTQSNRGLAYTLNQGLSRANGDFIARMDADDISLPHRLERQITYMLQHPEVDICGSWVKTICNANNHVTFYSTSHDAIQCELLFRSAFAHPATFIRRTLIESSEFYYDINYAHCEDYDLWSRLIGKYRGANLPAVLLSYRHTSEQISSRFSTQQLEGIKQIQKRQLFALGLIPTDKELELHFNLSQFKFEATELFVEDVEHWLIKLKQANTRANIYSYSALSHTLLFYWYNVCKFAAKASGCWIIPIFLRSPLITFNSVIQRSYIKYQEKRFSLKSEEYNWQ
jgi:glycosyltransferase involved in cell wall biosynthesis